MRYLLARIRTRAAQQMAAELAKSTTRADGRFADPINRLKLLITDWDSLSPERWRNTGLTFDTVLTRRARVLDSMIADVRELVGEAK